MSEPHTPMSKETEYIGKRDLLYRQKRPTINETCPYTLHPQPHMEPSSVTANEVATPHVILVTRSASKVVTMSGSDWCLLRKPHPGVVRNTLATH